MFHNHKKVGKRECPGGQHSMMCAHTPGMARVRTYVEPIISSTNYVDLIRLEVTHAPFYKKVSDTLQAVK